MAPLYILIINSCDHQTSRILSSILLRHFKATVRTVDAKGEPSLMIDGSMPDLLFWVSDSSKPNGAAKLLELPIPSRIFVSCSEVLETGESLALPPPFEDFLLSPLREEEVVCRTKRALGVVKPSEKEKASEQILAKLAMTKVIGKDPVFLGAMARVPKVAESDAAVLISGETGVGKEVCARAIHYLSRRSQNPFIPIACGSIPENLLENELFGHGKDAFTGARRDQLGLVAEADGGTLFLDEIDTLSLKAQVSLLRLIQDRIYRPLGRTKYIQADIRVIAATNAELKQKILEGSFREDLYYRFCINLRLPPLRERKGDIPLLTEHFLKIHSSRDGQLKREFSPEAISKFGEYDFPGNIRELENIVQQAILLTTETIIPPEHINVPVEPTPPGSPDDSFREARRSAIEAFEKKYLSSALTLSRGNITHAARQAGIDRSDFSRLAKKHNLIPKSFVS